MTDKTADEILERYMDILEPALTKMTEYTLLYGGATCYMGLDETGTPVVTVTRPIQGNLLQGTAIAPSPGVYARSEVDTTFTHPPYKPPFQ